MYGMQHAPVPAGDALWLYGDARFARGDVFTPYHDQVVQCQQRGLKAFARTEELQAQYDAVFINCPKQQEETEGLLALALERSRGFVMAVAANDAGGKRLVKLFEAYGVETHQLSKDRCQIIWTSHAQAASRNAIEENLALLLPHPLEMGGQEWWTVPGLFGWNKIDVGSKLLMEHLPADISGRVADFGCGFGYLTRTVLQQCPAVSFIDAFDVDARAVEVTKRNSGDKVNVFWQDMRQFSPTPQYDAVIMNPPFHSGKDEDIGLGEAFIRHAWASLRQGGRLFMVANRNLPYEQIVPQLKQVFAGQGYKIMSGRKV